jgi:AcrR family transcriptional regulator
MRDGVGRFPLAFATGLGGRRVVRPPKTRTVVHINSVHSYKIMDRRSHTPKGQAAQARILRAAEPLLASRGFHGTSMRDVAEAAELPLASIVYHFARKENLYAAVLAAIAAQVLRALERAARSEAEAEAGARSAVGAIARALVRWSLGNPRRVQLLVRELLDNPGRVSKAGALPLAPVLLKVASAARAEGHPQPELAVLHLFGAISYVVIARPTVRRILGPKEEERLMERYEEEAVALAAAMLAPPFPTFPAAVETAAAASTRDA